VRRLPRPSVARGDIIVFPYPVDPRQTFVKRIIGVPGDHIKISGKIVYRNGVSLSERYAVHKTGYVDSYRDNRDSSLDSRYWGFVGAVDLIGKPVLVYSSEDHSTEALSNGKRTAPRRI